MKLKEKELLEWLDNWRDFCGESCTKADCVKGIEECEPAYKQIKEMIQKLGVTETWIEEKAERFVLKCPGIIGWHSESVKKFAKDFIRSLVEEIRK